MHVGAIGNKVDAVLTKVVRLLAPEKKSIPVNSTVSSTGASYIAYDRSNGEPHSMTLVIPPTELEAFMSRKAGYRFNIRRCLYHETGHLLFTDGRVTSVNQLLFNALEDGRIERLTGERYRGTREYFQYLQTHEYLEEIKKNPGNLMNPYFVALAGSQLEFDDIKAKIKSSIPQSLWRFFEAGEEARNCSSSWEVEEIVKRLLDDPDFQNEPMKIKVRVKVKVQSTESEAGDGEESKPQESNFEGIESDEGEEPEDDGEEESEDDDEGDDDTDSEEDDSDSGDDDEEPDTDSEEDDSESEESEEESDTDDSGDSDDGSGTGNRDDNSDSDGEADGETGDDADSEEDDGDSDDGEDSEDTEEDEDTEDTSEESSGGESEDSEDEESPAEDDVEEVEIDASELSEELQDRLDQMTEQIQSSLEQKDIIDSTDEAMQNRMEELRRILPQHEYEVRLMTSDLPAYSDYFVDDNAVMQITDELNALRYESKKQSPVVAGTRFNLMRYVQGDEKIFRSGRSNTKGGVAICVVIDASSSMSGNSIIRALDCLRTMQDAFKGTDVVWMAFTYRTASLRGLNIDILKDWTDDCIYGPAVCNDYTPTGPAIDVATALLDCRNEAVKAMLIVTDGEANTEWDDWKWPPDKSKDDAVKERLLTCLEKGYYISIVGIGHDPAKYDPLDGRTSHCVWSADDLAQLFTKLTNEILETQRR